MTQTQGSVATRASTTGAIVGASGGRATSMAGLASSIGALAGTGALGASGGGMSSSGTTTTYSSATAQDLAKAQQGGFSPYIPASTVAQDQAAGQQARASGYANTGASTLKSFQEQAIAQQRQVQLMQQANLTGQFSSAPLNYSPASAQDYSRYIRQGGGGPGYSTNEGVVMYESQPTTTLTSFVQEFRGPPAPYYQRPYEGSAASARSFEAGRPSAERQASVWLENFGAQNAGARSLINIGKTASSFPKGFFSTPAVMVGGLAYLAGQGKNTLDAIMRKDLQAAKQILGETGKQTVAGYVSLGAGSFGAVARGQYEEAGEGFGLLGGFKVVDALAPKIRVFEPVRFGEVKLGRALSIEKAGRSLTLLTKEEGGGIVLGKGGSLGLRNIKLLEAVEKEGRASFPGANSLNPTERSFLLDNTFLKPNEAMAQTSLIKAADWAGTIPTRTPTFFADTPSRLTKAEDAVFKSITRMETEATVLQSNKPVIGGSQAQKAFLKEKMVREVGDYDITITNPAAFQAKLLRELKAIGSKARAAESGFGIVKTINGETKHVIDIHGTEEAAGYGSSAAEGYFGFSFKSQKPVALKGEGLWITRLSEQAQRKATTVGGVGPKRTLSPPLGRLKDVEDLPAVFDFLIESGKNSFNPLTQFKAWKTGRYFQEFKAAEPEIFGKLSEKKIVYAASSSRGYSLPRSPNLFKMGLFASSFARSQPRNKAGTSSLLGALNSLSRYSMASPGSFYSTQISSARSQPRSQARASSSPISSTGYGSFYSFPSLGRTSTPPSKPPSLTRYSLPPYLRLPPSNPPYKRPPSSPPYLPPYSRPPSLPPYLRPPPFKPPTTSRGSSDLGAFGKFAQGFLVFGRRRGKFAPLNKQPLVLEEGLSLGASFARNTLGATFKLVPYGSARAGQRQATTTGNLMLDFRPPKQGGFLTFVQRASKRLSSWGEKQEIKRARK